MVEMEGREKGRFFLTPVFLLFVVLYTRTELLFLTLSVSASCAVSGSGRSRDAGKTPERNGVYKSLQTVHTGPAGNGGIALDCIKRNMARLRAKPEGDE